MKADSQTCQSHGKMLGDIPRLNYIDAVKGFAILLVVMGHVLAWMFDDYRVILTQSPSPSYLWKIIYSFHMPLFMFVSGFVNGLKPIDTWSRCFGKVTKSALGLLVPYFVSGLILYFSKGENLGRILRYWYLLTLFELIVISGFVQILSSRLSTQIHRLAFESCLIFVIYHIVGYLMRFEVLRWIEISSLHKYLPIYFVGLLSCRTGFFDAVNLSKKGVVVLALASGVAFILKDFMAVYWLVTFFVISVFRIIPTEHVIMKVLSKWGKITLQVYIIHLYFLPKFPDLGNWFVLMVSNGRIGILKCFGIQLCLSIAMSVVIIYLCWLVASCFSYSKWLSKLLFGRTLDMKIWERGALP